MYTIRVNEQKQYDVFIGNNILNKKLETTLMDQNVVFFVDDKTNFKTTKLAMYFSVDEKLKDIESYQEVISFLMENNIKRVDTIFVVIGGGVLIDLIGYVASTYMRGIKLVCVPTTLLSMVDVSIGSKNGINFKGVKNCIGTFYSPEVVIIDTDFLKSLDERNLNNGYAEIIKYGAIKDLNLLKKIMKPHCIKEIIRDSLNIKKYYVEKDPFDKSVRRALNFGHTYGHAIESYYSFEKYLHGEAVSIGMNLMCNDELLIKACQKYKLPIKDEVDLKLLEKYLKHDKKDKFVKLIRLGEVDV